MYKVFIDDEQIYDPRSENAQILEPVVVLEENTAGSFTFKVAKTNPFYNAVSLRKSIVTVTDDGDTIFKGIAIDENTDFWGNKQFSCEGELTYLNDSIQRPARYQGVTVRGLLEAYINAHNEQVGANKAFFVGMVTVSDPNDSLYRFTNMESTMECIKRDLVDDLGGYIRIRYEDGKRYIDYLADAMRTNSQIIRLGVNLLDYKSNINSEAIATAIIPLGAQEEISSVEGLETRVNISSINGGKDFVFNQDAVDAFGWVYKTIIYDGVTDKNYLKRKGNEVLSVTQFENVFVEATVVDLHLADVEYERFRLSDDIQVVSRAHGMDKRFRLTKQTLHLKQPESDTFTLGRKETRGISATASRVSESLKQTIERITPTSKVLRLAQDNATAMINGNGDRGHVVLHENADGVVYEILVMDTADIATAQTVWRWNENGLGYSSNGYNGTYGTAITADGRIVANDIISNISRAAVIKGGALEIGGNGEGADGKIIVRNSSGTPLITLDINGITLNEAVGISANNIKGGTLTLGGAYGGKLIFTDSLGRPLVAMNENGFVVGDDVIDWSSIKNHDGVVEGSYSYGTNYVSQNLECSNLKITGGGIDMTEGSGFIKMKNSSDASAELQSTKLHVSLPIAGGGSSTADWGADGRIYSSSGAYCVLSGTSLTFYDSSGSVIKKYP